MPTGHDMPYLTVLKSADIDQKTNRLKVMHKHIIIQNGAIIKADPLNVFKNNVSLHEFNTLEDLYNVLKEASKKPENYIIRGYPNKENNQKGIDQDGEPIYGKGLKNMLRRDVNFIDIGTPWVCVDMDKLGKYTIDEGGNRQYLNISDPEFLKIEPNSKRAIQWIIDNCFPEEFHEIGYVIQWSSSSGVFKGDVPYNNSTSAHVFFMLDRPLTYIELKRWLAPQIEQGIVDPRVLQLTQPILITNKITVDDRDQNLKYNVKTYTEDTRHLYHSRHFEPIELVPGSHRLNTIVYTPEANAAILTMEKKLGGKAKNTTKKQDNKKQESVYIKSVFYRKDGSLNQFILDALDNSGSIFNKNSNGTISLCAPSEKTAGGYYIHPDKLYIVRHPDANKNASIEDWLSEHYMIKLEVPQKEITDKVLASCKSNKQLIQGLKRKQRWIQKYNKNQ